MKTEYGLLVSLVREVMCEPRCDAADKSFNPDQLSALLPMLKLAKEHDVLPIVAEALEAYSLPDEYSAIVEKIARHKFVAVHRVTSILSEQTAVSQLFSEAGIRFILLKGAVIRNYYPEVWMRTSSDIDILLHKEDVEGAMELLKNKLEYTFYTRSPHDVSLFAPSGVHVELHFKLIEDARLPESAELLANAWEYAEPSRENGLEYIFNDEMYYFYHIAHMSKHFHNGGCGLRSFIDLWLMDNRMPCVADKRRKLLEKGGLDSFAKAVSALASVWLSGTEHTDITRRIEEFILPAGVYGNIDNMVAAGGAKKGGKFAYIMSRLFLPYEDLKNRYPKMGKHKILLPLLQIRRWLALLTPTGRKRAQSELGSIKDMNSEELNSAAELIDLLRI